LVSDVGKGKKEKTGEKKKKERKKEKKKRGKKISGIVSPGTVPSFRI